MSFHRFKIFPLKNNKFNIINVICSLHNLKGREISFLEASFVQSEQPPAPKCHGKLLAEWQRLVTTLKRSIYTSLVKYQILKRGKKSQTVPDSIPRRARSAGKGPPCCWQCSWWVLEAFEKQRVGIRMVQIRLCGRPCSWSHSEFQDFIPFAFLAGSCSI